MIPSHINCTLFLHRSMVHTFLSVSLNCLHEMIQSNTGCICLTFLHCVFSASSNRLHPPLCVFKRVLKEGAKSHWLHLFDFSPLCFQMPPQIACSWGCKVTFYSTVRFQMSPRITCLWGYKITLVAFVWFFSTMRFQMCPQIACLRRGKVTLNAFVWRFSTVRFQMSYQIACPRRGKVTLVAFVWLFSTVRF